MSDERVYLLKGLDCPNCAAKIEQKIGAISGVSAASIDFIGRRLALSYDNGEETPEMRQKIEAVIKSVEPGVALEEAQKADGSNGQSNTAESRVSRGLVLLIAGAAVYAAGITAQLLHAAPFVTIPLFSLALLLSGGEVFIKAVRNILRGQMFDENLLMSIASAGAFAIGQFAEGAAVMLFNQVGEYFQDLAADRSKKSIVELMGLRPDYARLKSDEGSQKVLPQSVPVGALIEVRPGEKVPLDGIIVSGRSFVDTSGLTGEPVPRAVGEGDAVTGGFVNKDGLLTVRVEKAYGESTVAKIITLIENSASKKAKAESFITKFAHWYTPAVTIGALLLAVVPPLATHSAFTPWIYRALIFLVVSCPCALVVSVPMGYFAGIGAASFNGILVKGGSYLEMLSKAHTAVFDKTGTLTKGVFEVSEILTAEGVTREEVLAVAALAEGASNHPVARSILNAAGTKPAPDAEFTETAGMGVVARLADAVIAAGNSRLMEREKVRYTTCEQAGTVVYVARNGQYLGCIVISDTVREDAASSIAALKRLGIGRTVMLTGDSKGAANAVASKLGIDSVRAGLLPDGKVAEFESVAADGGVNIFVGDGINDAPVLARADVGIAMGGVGSDAAVEAADIVIMDDKPSRVAVAVNIARYVGRVVRENIAFALAIKFAVLLLDTLGYVNIWAAVFADTGVALLAVLNSMRILMRRKKFNKV